MRCALFVYRFLTVLFLGKRVCASLSHTNSPLFTLIRLQLNYCFSIDMCTIYISDNGTKNQPSPNCCKTCSCEADCIQFGNCCPDYPIANLINENKTRTKSNSINELSDRLQNQNITLRDIEMLSRDEAFETLEGNISCVRSKAKNKDFHLEEDEYPQAYQMVTTCREDFKGTDDIKTRCVNYFEVHKFETNDIGPDLVVPVTSLKTNYTYKNKYCLLCNEGYDVFDDVIQWKVIFSSFNAYHILGIDDPHDIVKVMTSDRYVYASNLIYQPRYNIAHIVKRCNKVDVKSCPDDTDQETNKLCSASRHYLPVFSKSRNRLDSTVYKNIGCYLCNNRRTFKANCEDTYTRQESYNLQLNLLTSSQNTFLRYNSSEHQILNISFAEKGNRDKCEPGFIPFNGEELCRQTICPINFYLVNGKCIPTFHQMTNVSFTVVLEVIRAQKLQNNEKFEFYRKYTAKIYRIAANLSLNFTYTLWKITDYTDAIIVTLTKPEPTYRDLLQTMSEFKTRIALMEINTGISIVEVITTLFHDNSRPRPLAGKLYPPFGGRKSHIPYEMLYRFKTTSIPTSQIIMDKAHLCYRVRLDSSDVYVDNDGSFLLLNNTDKVLTDVNTRVLEDFSYIACIDEVNENIEGSYMFGGYTTAVKKKILAFRRQASIEIITTTDNTKGSESSGIELSKELVILIVFAVVVSLVCLSQFYIFIRRWRNAQET